MNKLRELRQKCGLSQTQLAILAGLPNQVISDFELGKRVPWPKARRALARALGVSEKELFADTRPALTEPARAGVKDGY
jgi:transcriptional regulator with XRE-family HTH domain